jgi:hypothetical protein
MCGPSGQEEQIAGQQSSLASTLQSNYNQQFANQSQVLSNLNNLYTPIAEAGPDQQGFGGQELAAINTQEGQGVGTNYAHASQALNNTLASQGGGNEFLPNGAQAELKGSLATSAANQLSSEQLQTTQANYAQGRQNYNQATAGLQTLASQYNPTGFASGANDAFKQSFTDANQIQTQKNQEQQAIASGIAGIAMEGAGGIGGGLSALGASPAGASQPGAFASGFLQGL